MSWFNRKSAENSDPPPKISPEPLTPGKCECGHARCNHIGGNGKCMATEPEWEAGDVCACQLYIRDDDADDGDAEPEPTDPEVAELEKLVRR